MPFLILLSSLVLAAQGVGFSFGLHDALWLIGHRGMGKSNSPTPENSLAAVREAFGLGVTAVEFDVQLSSDGEVVLAHDEDLLRTTGAKKCVAQTSLSEMKTLPMIDGQGHPHAEDRVALLSDVLTELKSWDRPARPFVADIHIKVYDGLRGDLPAHVINHCPKTDWHALTRKVLEQVASAGLSERVIYTSFDSRVLDLIRAQVPGERVGLLSLLAPREAIHAARAKNYAFVAIGNTMLEEAEIAEAHQQGLGVLLWFPNSEEPRWDQCAAGLVDGIITDHVERTLSIVTPPAALPCRIRENDESFPFFGSNGPRSGGDFESW